MCTKNFQHTCTSAGILIPTNADVLAKLDQQETYCGSYLNELNGNIVGGLVYGKFIFL
jgi:hypothetical protein